MAHSISTEGIVDHRLGKSAYDANFADLHPPLTEHESAVAADRCYFCHDAPCVTACPTDIDIPLFIRQIATGMPEAAARTIFDQNILGGMCARVCPTETLCEEACVREIAEHQPVEIGRLQRFATDTAMGGNAHPYARAATTGKHVAVVGAGPAGLACAHRLARHGHDVTIYEARDKPGGLNEYGIAAYKTVDDFAAREVDWLLGIGGIRLLRGQKITDLAALRRDHDAVFLGAGLGDVNRLAIDGIELDGVAAAVDFIADLRQATDPATVPVGRNVVVIGGGMTAVDAAVQARALGAREVHLVYRRDQAAMGASAYEQNLAAEKGVRIVTGASPKAVLGTDAVAAIEFDYSEDGAGGAGNEVLRLPADQVLIAIGQRLDPLPDLDPQSGKYAVDDTGRTSLPDVWAGGDCAAGGDDLTVTAVAEGRDAAEAIHSALMM